MRRWSILLISLLFILSISAQAHDHKGEELVLMGDSPLFLGRGFTGVSDLGSEYFFLNPAAVSLEERLSFGLRYGSLDFSYYNPSLSFVIPTSWGNIGSDIRYINLPGEGDYTQALGVSLGIGKPLTEKVLVGVGTDFYYASADGSLMYVGGVLGSIYRFEDVRGNGTWGLFNPRAGGSVRFGLPIGDGSSAVNMNMVTLGYNFDFFRQKDYTIGWYNDASAIKGYKAYPVKGGLQGTWKETWTARLGTVFPQAYDYGDITAGLGYHFGNEEYDGTVNYSVVHYRDYQTVHHLGVQVSYGKLDREPPVTKIETNHQYFSPNHDGTKDFVLFELDTEDQSNIKGWKLQVRNQQGDVVREYRISERDIIEGLTMKGFFRRLFSKKESLTVPPKIMWDGTDGDGTMLPDGTYIYSFNAWDERDNISSVRKGSVVLDSTGPQVTLSTPDRLFSPNGDNVKDNLVISQNVVSAADDTWTGKITDVEGNVVREFSWEGSSIPRSISWNGKDSSGNDVPEGLYYYSLTSEDKAGNQASDIVREIALTRKYQVADIETGSTYFSIPVSKEVTLSPVLSNTNGLQKWQVSILDSQKKNVVKSFAGDNSVPQNISWDGKDSEGAVLKDGEWFVRFEAWYDSGNHPVSFDKKVIIDTTPPDLSVKASPEYFSPDGDGERDILILENNARDMSGIETWKMNVYEPSGQLFKTFSGTGDVPDALRWDGIGDNGELVESASDYTVKLEAVDLAGNRSVSPKEVISVDILVIVTERGLKMRISNIEFAFNSATIKGNGRRILDRVAIILKKYRRYDVIVEGHTDDVGQEEYNLKLSERRAVAVKEYLVKKGIDESRFSTVGMGETVPLYPNDNAEHRRRNRRVEFLLIKME